MNNNDVKELVFVQASTIDLTDKVNSIALFIDKRHDAVTCADILSIINDKELKLIEELKKEKQTLVEMMSTK